MATSRFSVKALFSFIFRTIGRICIVRTVAFSRSDSRAISEQLLPSGQVRARLTSGGASVEEGPCFIRNRHRHRHRNRFRFSSRYQPWDHGQNRRAFHVSCAWRQCDRESASLPHCARETGPYSLRVRPIWTGNLSADPRVI